MAGSKRIEFPVTACLGGGDGGDILVTVDVTAEELKLLKKCIRNEEEIEGYEGLEDLVERINEAAISECESIDDVYGDEEVEEDFSSASFMIGYPDEL